MRSWMCRESGVGRCRTVGRCVGRSGSPSIEMPSPPCGLVAEKRQQLPVPVSGLRPKGRTERVGRSFLFLFPVPWDRLSWRRSAAPCFPLPNSPAHTALRFVWFPGPTEPSDWPCFLKKQFRRTILGSLLIPVNATPGGLSCFGARSAWQLMEGFQKTLGSFWVPRGRERAPPTLASIDWTNPTPGAALYKSLQP